MHVIHCTTEISLRRLLRYSFTFLIIILFPCLGHSEVPMLSERYPPEPPHGAVAFYPAYGAKPDLPIYVPHGAHPPGPPPLLASKRDGPETHMLPAFYPSPYPPPVSL